MNEIWAALWLGTFIYWGVGIFFLIWNLIPIPPNFSDKGLVATCIVTATFSCWLFWALIYMSQMYPLPGVAPQILWPDGSPGDYYFPEREDSCYVGYSVYPYPPANSTCYTNGTTT